MGQGCPQSQLQLPSSSLTSLGVHREERQSIQHSVHQLGAVPMAGVIGVVSSPWITDVPAGVSGTPLSQDRAKWGRVNSGTQTRAGLNAEEMGSGAESSGKGRCEGTPGCPDLGYSPTLDISGTAAW